MLYYVYVYIYILVRYKGMFELPILGTQLIMRKRVSPFSEDSPVPSGRTNHTMETSYPLVICYIAMV